MDWETSLVFPIVVGVGVVERSSSSSAKGAGLCKSRLGVVRLSRSKSSSCNAVSMAFRTREDVEVEVCLVCSGASDCGGSGGSDFDEATDVGLPGRSDCAEGLRFGKVLIEPVTDVPDDLELTVATLLALEDASLDNFDCGLEGIDVGVGGSDF